MKRIYAMWLYALTLTALSVAAIQSLVEERRLLADANTRSSTLVASIEDSVLTSYTNQRYRQIAKVANRLHAHQHILGLALCPAGGYGPALGFPRGSDWERICATSLVTKASTKPAGHDMQGWSSKSGARIQYYAHFIEPMAEPDENPRAKAGTSPPLILVLAQDLSWIRKSWVDTFERTFALTWFGGLLILGIVALQARSWFRRQIGLIRSLLRSTARGGSPKTLPEETSKDLQPLTRDIRRLGTKLRLLSDSVTKSEPVPAGPSWLNEAQRSIEGRNLLIIANREPYIHQRHGDKVEVVRPASGLVTALEPILRSCGGLWIAHGSGSADREVCNVEDEVAVPPGRPSYKLKRVWMTPEEEAGYYYGFSNEGLWPLCHLAHTRPTFRLSDWDQYRAINKRFSEAIPERLLDSRSLILVQDYHFALLPRMIQERQKKDGSPKVAIFWHIPWPNPEAFGICPWNPELLRGMLGADVIGFHTQYHCNNFLETCNRYLEARIDYEKFSVTMENRETLIRAFPIGIDTAPVRTLSDQEREDLKAKYGIHASFIAVGVDRLDYTKGIIERVEAVERFLEKHPEQVGKFALVQMGSPSRSQIPAYQALVHNLEETVRRVNQRYGHPDGYQPIYFLPNHHEWDEIQYFYQLGDVCMVTSLHDGMNLVAKEYVWCQKPERGALILSKFTGASRELNEAFIVNPYSIEEMADAIHAAVELPAEERSRRMLSMKSKIEGHNAFHWASDLIRSLIQTDENVPIPTKAPDLPNKTPLAGVVSA